MSSLLLPKQLHACLQACTCNERAHDHKRGECDVQPGAEAPRHNAGQAEDGQQVDDKGVAAPAHDHVQVAQHQGCRPGQRAGVERLQGCGAGGGVWGKGMQGWCVCV